MGSPLYSQSNMLIIGHRGAMGYEVENSISSFKKAIEMNTEMIELDVFRCKSGEIMVFHDEHLNRLANKDALIEDLTFEDLSELHLSNGQHIPTLLEVLELCSGKAKINIELKGENTAESVALILSEFIKKSDSTIDDYLISSFHWDELKRIRKLNSEIKIGVLTQISPVKAIEVAQQINAYSIHPRFNSLNTKKVKKIHESGYVIYAYTVNSEKDILKMIQLKIDGIFTNFPDKAMNLTARN